jgi:hypothetical protein
LGAQRLEHTTLTFLHDTSGEVHEIVVETGALGLGGALTPATTGPIMLGPGPWHVTLAATRIHLDPTRLPSVELPSSPLTIEFNASWMPRDATSE